MNHLPLQFPLLTKEEDRGDGNSGTQIYITNKICTKNFSNLLWNFVKYIISSHSICRRIKMQLLFAVITLLTMVFTYSLVAQDDLYTLEAENSGFKNISTWIKSSSQPLPVSRTRVLSLQNEIELTDAIFFYIDKDIGFGKKQLIGNQQNPLLKISWYDQNGEPFGTWQMPWYNDLPLPSIRIDHHSGNLVCVDLQNQIRIINSEGKISNQFRVLESYKYNSENNAYTDLNNGLLSVGITEIFPSLDGNPKYKSSIRVYELNGRLRMRFDLPEWQIRSLNGSSNGQLTAASFFRKDVEGSSHQFRTLVLDMEANIIVDQSVKARKTIFNHDNSMSYLLDKNVGYLLDIASNRLITETNVKDTENIYLSAVFTPPTNFIIIQEGKAKQEIADDQTSWIYDNIRILSLDNLGREKYDLPVDNITIDKPALWYDSKSKRAFCGTSPGLENIQGKPLIWA